MNNYEIYKIRIAEKFAMKTDVDNVSELNSLSDFMDSIKTADEALFNEINDFFVVFDAYTFTKTDNDLRLKAQDLWKQQYEFYKSNITDKVNNIKELAKENNVDLEDDLKELNLENE